MHESWNFYAADEFYYWKSDLMKMKYAISVVVLLNSPVLKLENWKLTAWNVTVTSFRGVWLVLDLEGNFSPSQWENQQSEQSEIAKNEIALYNKELHWTASPSCFYNLNNIRAVKMSIANLL